MTAQPIGSKRCLSCRRWGGKRWIADERGVVLYDEHDAKGPCVEGPWHGTLRGPRNACGHWVLWPMLSKRARCEAPREPGESAA